MNFSPHFVDCFPELGGWESHSLLRDSYISVYYILNEFDEHNIALHYFIHGHTKC